MLKVVYFVFKQTVTAVIWGGGGERWRRYTKISMGEVLKCVLDVSKVIELSSFVVYIELHDETNKSEAIEYELLIYCCLTELFILFWR